MLRIVIEKESYGFRGGLAELHDSFGLSSRMLSLVQVLKAFVSYVGVYLGGGYVGVPQHGLDYPQVGTPFKEVCGERVAYYVGLAPGPADPGQNGVLLHHRPEVLAGHGGGP